MKPIKSHHPPEVPRGLRLEPGQGRRQKRPVSGIWQQRQKECKHHTAVRMLAFKWQRIIGRCWQDRVIYQEKLYEAALRRSGSPVVGLLKSIEVGKSPVEKNKKNRYPLLTDYLRGELRHSRPLALDMPTEALNGCCLERLVRQFFIC